MCTNLLQAFLPVFVPNPDGEFAFRVPVPPPSGRWDLFCSVVDNFGDIGVCWRLARQLAAEHGISVRLWVDDLHSAARLVPSLDTGQASQWVDGVELRRWDASFPAVRRACRAGCIRLPASGGLHRGHGASLAQGRCG